MAQVVTNENMLEFIQNRQVPEFKAPEAAKAAEESKAATAAASADSKAAVDTAAAQARGADGKFVKADETKQTETSAEPAAKAADDDEHDDDGAKLSDAVKRKIDKIVAKKHRAMKEAEEFGRDEARRAIAAEARAEALQKQIDELKGTKSGNGPALDKADKPKPEDFKTVAEYTDAMVEWEFNRRTKTQQQEQSTKAREDAFANAQQRLGERISEFAKTTPDYAEVMATADFDAPPHIQAYFVDSDHPGELGYHFAKNPDDYHRIAKLSPIRAFAELGKLEDKLFGKKPEPAGKDTATATATTQVSRAPAPINPLEGKSTSVSKRPEDMNFQELRAHRQAERAAGKYR